MVVFFFFFSNLAAVRAAARWRSARGGRGRPPPSTVLAVARAPGGRLRWGGALNEAPAQPGGGGGGGAGHHWAPVPGCGIGSVDEETDPLLRLLSALARRWLTNCRWIVCVRGVTDSARAKEWPMRGLRAIARHVTASVAAGTAVPLVQIGQEEATLVSEGVGKVGIEVERLHPNFGARLHNVDLEALSDEQWEIIQDAFDEYGVIVIPGQGDSLSPEALSDFARRFHREDPTE
eukprot:SAG11_NODE_234_length_11857_cov_15.265776_5_plen_234_part_00